MVHFWQIISKLTDRIVKSGLFFLDLNTLEELEKNRSELFMKLEIIDAKTKREKMELIKNTLLERHQAAYHFRTKVLFITLLVLIILLIIISLESNIINYIINNIFVKESNLYKLNNFVTNILSDFITVSLIIISAYYVYKRNWYVIIILTFLGFITEIIIFLNSWDAHTHYWINGIASACLTSIFYLPTTFLILYLVGDYVNFLISQFENRYSLSTLIDTLILILATAENTDFEDMLMNYKKNQLKYLEKASKCIEIYFPRNLLSGDFVTDKWTRETTEQVAAAIRDKKKWVITPKIDTNEYFIKSIAFILICIINGNWDELERKEVKKASVPRLRTLITIVILKLLRIFLLIGLPIAGFWVFQQLPLQIPDIVRGYIYAGLFLWELLTIIVLIDPNLNTKISAMKDITSLFQSPKTDNKL